MKRGRAVSSGANGGTLFLDEIGDLPLAAQAKLLRVLQTGEVERLGDDKPLQVKVRLISATNVNLHEAMRAGSFRSDLYYRLATYPITLPALRERPGDVPLLARAMVARYAPLYGKQVPGITERACRALKAYDWPGNVRELENFIERAVLLVDDGAEIGIEHLPRTLPDLAVPGIGPSGQERRLSLCDEMLDLGIDLEQHELQLVSRALARAGGNIAGAAALLNLTRRQLVYRMQKLRIEEPKGG